MRTRTTPALARSTSTHAPLIELVEIAMRVAVVVSKSSTNGYGWMDGCCRSLARWLGPRASTGERRAMLKVCGVGIAVGNATDAIKAHADEVTTSVLDDGVWNAFRRHSLI